jgi:hypothetical protein
LFLNIFSLSNITPGWYNKNTVAVINSENDDLEVIEFLPIIERVVIIKIDSVFYGR